MDKYYNLKDVDSKEIAEDFLEEEAVETINTMKDEGWQPLGVFDGKEFFCSDKYDALKDEWLASCE